MSAPETYPWHVVQLEHSELIEIIDALELVSENLHDSMKAYGEEHEEGKEWREKHDKLTLIVNKLAEEVYNWCDECKCTKCICDVTQSENAS